MQKIISNFTVDDITIEVIQKQIKTVRLTVHPPHGDVRISAPMKMELDTIRSFVSSRIHWIRKHQDLMRNHQWIAPLKYISGENHLFLGKNYVLKILEHTAAPMINVNVNIMEFFVRKNATRQKRKAIIDEWYRGQLKQIIQNLILQYEEKMNVHVEEWGVKKMKTRWGSCNTRAKRIWLNLELAKKPVRCIENVVVHEMVHLLERKHNAHFIQLMDTYLPPWQQYKDELNRYRVTKANWKD